MTIVQIRKNRTIKNTFGFGTVCFRKRRIRALLLFIIITDDGRLIRKTRYVLERRPELLANVTHIHGRFWESREVRL